MPAKVKEPWICPRCGRSLTVRNQEHACGPFDLEGQFANKHPVCRAAFDWLCEKLESFGQIDVLPIKTTIAFANTVNVAFLTTKRKGAEISIVMSRPLSSPRITASVPYSKAKTIYRTLVVEESELDSELESWLREAYSATTPR